MSLHWSVDILPSRKVFIISGNQREKPSVQISSHETTRLWQAWSGHTALLNVSLWCLGLLVGKEEAHLSKKGWICCQAAETSLENREPLAK